MILCIAFIDLVNLAGIIKAKEQRGKESDDLVA
jgi:hypothetical protein